MKPLIFYIDDESMNLTVFEAALPPDWDVVTFDNAAAAIKEMQNRSPWVIVSDQRMPGMKGVDLLDKARQICPKAIRMVATGFSDEQLIIESVRRAKIADYIRKPWDPDELVSRLQLAIDQYRESEVSIHSLPPIASGQDPNLGLERFKWMPDAFLSIGTDTVDLEQFDRLELQQLTQLAGVSGLPRTALIRQQGPKVKWYLFILDVNAPSENTAYSGVVIDVTHLKESEEKVMRHTMEVTKSNEFLAEFASHLAVAANDPLRNILNYLDLMKTNPACLDNGSVYDLLSRTRECADALKQAMQTILRLSRVSFAKLELESVALKGILDAVVDQHVNDRDFELRLASADFPTIWGDEKMLVQLFSNLLHAVSWSKEFAHRTVQISTDPGDTSVEVLFEGVSITQEQLDRALSVHAADPMGKDSNIDRSRMVLVRTIIQRMGGDLELSLKSPNRLLAKLVFAHAATVQIRSRLRLVA